MNEKDIKIITAVTVPRSCERDPDIICSSPLQRDQKETNIQKYHLVKVHLK